MFKFKNFDNKGIWDVISNPQVCLIHNSMYSNNEEDIVVFLSGQVLILIIFYIA